MTTAEPPPVAGAVYRPVGEIVPTLPTPNDHVNAGWFASGLLN